MHWQILGIKTQEPEKKHPENSNDYHFAFLFPLSQVNKNKGDIDNVLLKMPHHLQIALTVIEH